MRLFYALWPGPAVQQALGEWARGCHDACGGRRVPVEKLHVTVAFLGEVPAQRYPTLIDIGGAAGAGNFELIFDRIAYWRHNRIVHAAANAIPTPLAALARVLTERIAGAGLPIERRAFLPHVTLLRDAKRTPPRLQIAPLVWQVGALSLVETIQQEGKHAYRACESWTLSR